MTQRFGKYELLRRIGVGGMAEVFRARSHGAQGFVKEVVIKRILPAFTEDQDFVDMFINEARLAAKLRHVNIVQVLDFDQVDGAYYIAMELVDGADLSNIQSVARRRGLPIPQTLAVHLGVEALKGLNYAHSRAEGGQYLGIVHRDISPHNLLLSFSGEVKVGDFGIAKVAALASATRPGALKGKLRYMSPEQVRGDRIDHRSDLYSLGIVLWELLSGQRVYGDSCSEGELMAAVRRARVPDIVELKPDTPADLAAVLKKLLDPVQQQRYDNAAAALIDLSKLARANDTLAVADYLRRLLPAEAERDHRGQTELLQGVDNKRQLAEAPTRTLTRQPPTQTGPHLPAIPSAVVDHSSGQLSHSLQQSTWDIQRSLVRRKLLGLVGFAAAFLAALFVVGHTRSRQETPSTPPRAWASVTVASEPPAASVSVQGIALGASTPVVLSAPSGTSLEVEARSPGGGVSTQTVRLAGERAEPASVVLRIDTAKGAPQNKRSDRASRRPSGKARRRRHTLGMLRSRNTARRVGSAPKGSVDFAEPAKVAASTADAAQLPNVQSGTAQGSSASLQQGPVTMALPQPRPPPGELTQRQVSRTARQPMRHGSGRHRSKNAQAKPSQIGVLEIVVSPWARVTFDGKYFGTTPMRQRRVAAGVHVVKLENAELGKLEQLRVVVTSQKPVIIRRDWL